MANPTPAITFRVNLSLHSSEVIGPLGNEKNTAMLHPDRHDSADRAVESIANRANHLSTYAPTVNVMPNQKWVHGDEFTEYGQKAVYLRSMYGIGYAPADRAFLTVVEVN